MPIYYRETVIDPSSAGQRLYQPMPPQTQSRGGGQQSAAQQGGGTQTRRPPPQFQQQYSTTGTSAAGGGGQTTGNSSRTEEYSRTESGNWPSNFPKIPPPQGIVDDAQLERMAAELMKGKPVPGWEAQPGWTRQTQQSYTIETVVSELGPISRWPMPVETVPNSSGPPTFSAPQQYKSPQRAPQQHQKAPQPPPHQFQYSVSKSVSGGPRGGQPFPKGALQIQPKQQQRMGPGGQWSQFTEPGGMDFVPEKQRPMAQPPPQNQQQQFSQISGGQQQQPMAQGKQPQTQLAVQPPKQPPPSSPQSQQRQISQNYYEEYGWSSDQQAPQQNGHSQPKYPQQTKQREPEPQFHQIAAQRQVQPQGNKFQQSDQQQIRGQFVEYEQAEGAKQPSGYFGESRQIAQPHSQSTMAQGQQPQQTSFSAQKQATAPQQNVPPLTQQQKWAPQPQRGEPPSQQQTGADEPSNTIYYEQKMPPSIRETTMANQQQKQPSMEQTATGQQPNVPKGQNTTIDYEQQKGGGTAQPPQNQAQQQFQQPAPAQQQKYTANFPSGQPQAMEQQPQRQTKSGQQPQQGESQESADKEDEPPPEMQLAEADPYSLKEQQQQQEYGSRQGGWPPLQEQPYAHKKQMQQQQNGHPSYQEPLYVLAGQQPPDWDGHSPRNYQYFQQQPRGPQYYSPSSIGWEAIYGDDWALDGQMPPSFTTGPAWGDHLAYGQRVNLDRRRAESEQRKRHHSPVPGSAEHGYLFGGMDFVDHQQFDPYAYVGEPWDERQSRRDLHWGPPRRRGDFFGLDYATMPGERPPRPLSAEDAQNYQGYQALTPRKNFRLCGHITADPDAPLNIAEAQGLNELDSQYWVGDTLSNQRILVDHPLTDEEKRTFALLYGPGGFKPDHITVRPEPKPEEPVQFSVTIGPRKEYERRVPPPEGYVNPMKVEGESWILGNRDGYYGGHPTLHAAQTGGDHLAFHRPRNFPAHVPQWARQRMEQQGRRGARSLDRSLFAPAWSKVPQPQPPFWVKRDGSGAAGGFQMGGGQRPQKEAEGEQREEEGEEKMEIEGQKVAAQKQQMRPQMQQQQFKGKTQQPQKSSQQPLQQFEGRQKVAGQSAAPQKVAQQNEQMEEEESQSQAAPPQQQQQQRAPPKMQQKSQPQQQSQQIAYGGGGSFSKKMQEIHQQPKMQTTNSNSSERQREEGGGREGEWSQFTQPGGMDYAGQKQQQTSSRGQQQGGGQQFQQQPSYQLIVNPPKMHQGGIVPAKQPLTQRQEQQQQIEQQQQYYEFYEGRPMGQRQQQPSQIQPQGEKRTMGGGPPPSDGQWTQFTQPGGMAYGQGGQTQPRVWPSKSTRIVQQSGEVPLNSAEQETSGLENLAKMKLGEFPLRQRSLEEQQAAAAAGNGNIFVDAHGRPVQYVRETKLDPGTGQPVTREEWRLVEQQPRQPTAGGAYQFRPQNAARTAGPGAQPQKTSDAQWNQFTQPGGMEYGRQ